MQLSVDNNFLFYNALDARALRRVTIALALNAAALNALFIGFRARDPSARTAAHCAEAVFLACAAAVLCCAAARPRLRPAVPLAAYVALFTALRLFAGAVCGAALCALLWCAYIAVEQCHFRFVFGGSHRYSVAVASTAALGGAALFAALLRPSLGAAAALVWAVEPALVLRAMSGISLRPALVFVNFGWSCAVNAAVYFCAMLRARSDAPVFDLLDVSLMSSYLVFIVVSISGEVIGAKPRERRISLGLTEENPKIDQLIDVLTTRENELKIGTEFEN